MGSIDGPGSLRSTGPSERQQPCLMRLFRWWRSDILFSEDMSKLYYLDTMGCQMNERDSATLAGILEELGYQGTDEVSDADTVVFNTCTVRAKPHHKLFSKLGELKKEKHRRPDMIIAVCGCVAQIAADEIRRRAPYVDIIIGPRNYSAFQAALTQRQQVGSSGGPIVVTDESEKIPEGLSVCRQREVSAFVNVTYGCNNFCAYCIVPYTRGREQSRQMADITKEVEGLVTAGYKQVTLLGQNVNSYGRDLPNGGDFADLLTVLDQIPGLARLRFTTSHPKDLSEKLLNAMRDSPTVCEHLHLPIQSGDDRVLARMGRGYTYAHYRSLIAAARERIPHIAISTDVMVGFPGETEEQFRHTRSAFEEIRFDQAFMFKYNDRPGTAATQMPDKVPEDVKQQRLEELVVLQNGIGREINRQQLGQTSEVLVEGPDPKSPGTIRGRTRTNKLMIFPGDERLTGQLVQVRANKAYLWGFVGQASGES